MKSIMNINDVVEGEAYWVEINAYRGGVNYIGPARISKKLPYDGGGRVDITFPVSVRHVLIGNTTKVHGILLEDISVEELS